MEIIKTVKLTKYYGKARGIINLDLNVAQGEFCRFHSRCWGDNPMEGDTSIAPCLLSASD